MSDDTADGDDLIRTDPNRDDVVVRRERDGKRIDSGTYSDDDGVVRDYRGHAFSDGPYTLIRPEEEEADE